MKNLQFILFTIFIYVHGIYCSNENVIDTMYSAITQNCTLLSKINESELARLQPVFAECKNWTAISSIRSVRQLSDENKSNIRCLLFYESFISFCSYIPASQFDEYYIVLNKTELNKTTADTACDNLSILPKNDSYSLRIQQIIKNKEICEYVCKEYVGEVSGLNSLCAMSYYINEINLTKGKAVTTAETMKAENIEEQNLPISSEALTSKKDSVSKKELNSAPLKKDNLSGDQVGIQSMKSIVESKGNEIPADDTDNKLLIEQSTLDNPEHESKKKNIVESGTDDQPEKHASEQKIDNPVNEKSESIVDIPEYKEPNKKPAEQGNVADGTETRDETIVDDNVNVDSEKKGLLNDDQPVLDGKDNTPLTGPYEVQEYELENFHKPEMPGQILEVKKILDLHAESLPDRFKVPKASELSEPYSYDADMDGNSYFFSYFSFTCAAFVIGYVAYHNKQKLLALLLEGRHSRKSNRGRRPNSANYHKLDCNLEEAISSSCTKNPSHIIY